MATVPAWGVPPEPGTPTDVAAPLLKFKSSGGSGRVATREELLVLMTWLASVAIGMIFCAFVSAFVVRQGLSGDWVRLALPRLVWLNTGLLLVSSLTLEIGRRRDSRAWLWVTTALGSLFLVGQLAAWRELAAHGVSLGTTPYGSFFYLFTGAHGVHLVTGLAALAAAALWPGRGLYATPRAAVVRASAIYWHFLDALWLGLFLLLTLGR